MSFKREFKTENFLLYYENQAAKDKNEFLEDLGLAEYKDRFKIFRLEENHFVDGKTGLKF